MISQICDLTVDEVVKTMSHTGMSYLETVDYLEDRHLKEEYENQMDVLEQEWRASEEVQREREDIGDYDW